MSHLQVYIRVRLTTVQPHNGPLDLFEPPCDLQVSPKPFRKKVLTDLETLTWAVISPGAVDDASYQD